jgi:uncharacterized coiled-coil protein SlyX
MTVPTTKAPEPQAMFNELHKQRKRIAELEATVTQQQKRIEGMAAGLEKVSDQLEASKPTPQVVANDQ